MKIPSLKDVGNAVGQAAGAVAQGVGQAAQAAGQAVSDVAQTAAEGVKNVVEGAPAAVTNAAEAVVQTPAGVATAAADSATTLVSTAATGVANAVTELPAAVVQAAEGVGQATEQAVGAVGQAVSDFGKTLGGGASDAASSLRGAASRTYGNTVAELGRTYDNLSGAVSTTYRFLDNQVNSMGSVLTEAEKRIREGKLVDAVWGVMIEPLQNTEENTGQAVLESTLLNQIASVGAAAFGGPGGSAAYAAWFTYRATGGNLDAALRAGALAYLTSSASKAVDSMPTSSLDDQVRRVIVSSSVGAAAVAASGGSDEDVLLAFGKGAAVGVARTVYKTVTKTNLDAKPAANGALAKVDEHGNPLVRVDGMWKPLLDENGDPILDADGRVQIDVTSLPKDASHVGIASTGTVGGLVGAGENSATMQLLAKIPAMNDMAYFHDQWAAVAQMQGVEVQITILPAMVLTWVGAEPQLVQPMIQQIVEENKEEAQAEGAA